jgi:single-strand DNA-binding protein
MADLRLPSLNRILIAGRLTRDPELRYTPSGTAVCNLRLASSRRYRDKSGEWQDDSTFVNVVTWSRTAENCGEYLKKGSAVLVEGRLQSRAWETEDGQKRSVVEINALRVEFLDKVGGSTETEPSESVPSDTSAGGEDIPF